MPSPTSSASSSVDPASPGAIETAVAIAPYARESIGSAWPVDSRPARAAVPPVPDGIADHALLDQRDPLLRRALEVELRREVAGVERVVDERDLRVERALADPAGEVASLLEQGEPVEHVERAVVEELGDRVRLEDGAVLRRRRLLRVARPRGLRDRLLGSLGRVHVADSPRGAGRVAGRAVDRGQGEPVRVGRPLRCAQAGARCDRELDHAAREVPVQAVVAGRGDRSRRQARLVVGAERGRLLVVAAHVGELGGRGERREIRVGARARDDVGCAANELGEALVVGSVGGRDAGPPVADEPELDARVVDQRRLVHLLAGVPGEPGVLGRDDDLGLVAGDEAERALRELESLAHAFTPTWTFRNRAGDAPCETCACWPGWPLPQFVRPCITHSSGPATRSSEPQKTGVTPV